jgi:NADPH:quinone reductase
MQAVRVNSFGGPEAFTVVEVIVQRRRRPRSWSRCPSPGSTIWTSTSGLALAVSFPVVPPYLAGVEGVGVVVEVGAEVADLREGQRVGWLSGGQGSFADYVAMEAAKAVPIPTMSKMNRLQRYSCTV